MNWPGGPVLLVALLDTSIVDVKWSASVPSTLPDGLLQCCVRNFSAAQSISRAIFDHWKPEIDDVDDVQRVNCEDNTVLTACKIRDVDDLLFGVFVHGDLPERLDMNELAPSLIKTACILYGNPDLLDESKRTLSGVVDYFSKFWSNVLFRISPSSHNAGHAQKNIWHALQELVVIHTTATSQHDGNEVEGHVACRNKGVDGTQSRISNSTFLDNECNVGYCLIQIRDNDVQCFRKMTWADAKTLSWYFEFVISSAQSTELFEECTASARRAWFIHQEYAVCIPFVQTESGILQGLSEGCKNHFRAQASMLLSKYMLSPS